MNSSTHNGKKSIKQYKFKCRDSLLRTLDALFSLAIVCPLVVAFWRGSWQLSDIYIFPNNIIFSWITSFSFGVSILILFAICETKFTKAIVAEDSPVLFFIVSRSYTAIFGLAAVNQWRGVWIAWDTLTGTSWQSGVAALCVGLSGLAITRGIKNTAAAPFFIQIDDPKGYFAVPLLFKSKERKKNNCIRLFDILFSIIIIGIFVVSCWRGGWTVLDRTLYPSNIAHSLWASLVIGVVVSVILFIAEPGITSSHSSFFKNCVLSVFLQDIYFTCCLIGEIACWRAWWLGFNVYLIPESLEPSNWISALVGIFGLICIFCSNSVSPRGALMDGGLPHPESFSLSTRYLRSYLQDSGKNFKGKEDA